MNLEPVLAAIEERSVGCSRYLIAIAGPPGAGKSTLSQELANRLPPGSAMVVGMDGFHYDNVVLDSLGLRSRKGAPETFDYPGFVGLLKRIRLCEPSVAIAVFDRSADLARAGAAVIDTDTKFVIVEGNYLLLDEVPWSGLADCFDLSVFLDVPKAELRRRLLARWLELGYSHEKAEHWVDTNDMPNVERVLSRRRAGDVCISPMREIKVVSRSRETIGDPVL